MQYTTVMAGHTSQIKDMTAIHDHPAARAKNITACSEQMQHHGQLRVRRHTLKVGLRFMKLVKVALREVVSESNMS